jgi:hypothetical protein
MRGRGHHRRTMIALHRHLRAWYAAQAQPQPDGGFLVRPFWPGAGVFALPDAAAQGRYATVRAACHAVQAPLLLGAILLAAIAPARGVLPIGAALAAAAGVLLGLGWVRDRLSLRDARRVPLTRWAGPRLRDPHGIYPRWLWWALLSGGLLLVGLGVPRIWALADALPEAGMLPGAAGTAGAAAIALRAAWALTAERPPRPDRR